MPSSFVNLGCLWLEAESYSYPGLLASQHTSIYSPGTILKKNFLAVLRVRLRERHSIKMLAITFMPLLMAAIPLASANPFTFPSNQGQPKDTLATITITSPATTSATATTTTATAMATPTPATRRPKETQPLELRDGGFAASIGTAAGATTTALLAADQAQTTAAPSDDPEADSDLAREGYSQTTYYSCEAFATTTHCGWHVPVVHLAAAGRLRAAGAAAAMGAAGVGMLVAW